MANADQSKPLQRAHSSNYISPGHFGTANYDTDKKQWHFLRQTASSASKASHGEVHIPAIELLSQTDEHATPAPAPAISHNKSYHTASLNVFLKTLPEAAQCDTYIANTRTPLLAAVEKSSLHLSLLAFGSALILGSDDHQSGLQTTPIAAHVKSTDPEILSLSILDRQTISISPHGSLPLQIPHIPHRQSVVWRSMNGVILHICFSQRFSTQGATWLAVRQATTTTIFQPLFYRAAAKVSGDSPLDPNSLIEIPISKTGGSQQADVMFHPHDPHRLAIIDEAGNWSVWEITGSRAKSARVLYRAQLRAQGHFATQSDRIQQYDGWHNIMWLGNGNGEYNCIAICNRKSIGLANTEGVLLYTHDVRIGQRKEGWMLGIVPGPGPDSFFILTSIHIFVVTIKPAVYSDSVSQAELHLSVISYWSHNQGQNSKSLRLHSLGSKSWICLFLESARNGFVAVYHCFFDDRTGQPLFSRSDSVNFPNPRPATNATRCAVVQSIEVEYTGTTVERSANYFQIFYEQSNGTLSAALYRILWLDGGRKTLSASIPLPKPRNLTHKSAYRVREAFIEDDFDDFVTVDDEIEYSDSIDVSKVGKQNEQLYMTRSSISRGKSRTTLCDMQRTYKDAAVPAIPSRETHADHIEDITSSVESAFPDIRTAETLGKLFEDNTSGEMHISDIEQTSQWFNSWISVVTGVGDLEASSEVAVSTMRTGLAESIIEIYEELVDICIIPLSESVPDRSRVQLERLLRQVAFELYLASVLVRPLYAKSTDTSKRESGKAVSSDINLSSDLGVESSSVYPTSSTLVSHRSLMQDENQRSVLDSYTVFDRPKIPSDTAAVAIEDLLAHLPVSAREHPDDYDYGAIELDLTLTKDHFATQNLDPKTRRKAEKLARAQTRQLEKQARIKKMAFDTTKSLPTINSSQLPIRTVQSSQAFPHSSSQPTNHTMADISMSQPERGVHGRRDTRTTKPRIKSSRQKGF